MLVVRCLLKPSELQSCQYMSELSQADFAKKENLEALPRVELGLVDSESTVITTTLQRRLVMLVFSKIASRIARISRLAYRLHQTTDPIYYSVPPIHKSPPTQGNQA